MRYRLSQRHLNSGKLPIKKSNHLHPAEEEMEVYLRKSRRRKYRLIMLNTHNGSVIEHGLQQPLGC
jgi:hypothetical protein